MIIRRARADEAAALTALARRSKAHWGYSAELTEKFAPELVTDADRIERHEVWVLADELPLGILAVAVAAIAVAAVSYLAFRRGGG